MEKHDFIFELGCEELPPKSLQQLAAALKANIVKELAAAKLEHAAVTSYATPRRLALSIEDLPIKQADQTIDKIGPATAICRNDNGELSAAALGFARSCAVEFAQLETIDDKGVEKLFYRQRQAGASVAELMPQILKKSLDKLPIAKRMRWGDCDYLFVRPVRWLLLMHGSNIINATLYGANSDNKTYGHRFLSKNAIELKQAKQYAQLLRQQGFVEPDFALRKQNILQQIDTIASKINATAIYDDALLDEVTALVEYPLAILGEFDHQFLKLPQEALIATMQEHQKYFALADKDNNLLPKFIAVANIQSTDPKQIKQGNERVIYPRFADAEFFFEQDKKLSHQECAARLDKIIFHAELGTVYQKTLRIAKLGKFLAVKLSEDEQLIERAAKLCKNDLVSNMVQEFPKMQGIAGKYYALFNREPAEVAAAIEEHYLPRFANDDLPQHPCSYCLALADKLDTLAGIWSVGLKPTGSKDSYALRRTAVGILRILIAHNLALKLEDLVEYALQIQINKALNDENKQQILDFLRQRLQVLAQEQGYDAEQVQAVSAVNPATAADFMQRLAALKLFMQSEQAVKMVAVSKRTHNIFKKITFEHSNAVETDLFATAAEKNLYRQLLKIRNQAADEIEKGNYQQALLNLAQLEPDVASFFEDVIVLGENKKLTANRIALLKEVHGALLGVADFFKLID